MTPAMESKTQFRAVPDPIPARPGQDHNDATSCGSMVYVRDFVADMEVAKPDSDPIGDQWISTPNRPPSEIHAAPCRVEPTETRDAGWLLGKCPDGSRQASVSPTDRSRPQGSPGVYVYSLPSSYKPWPT